MIPLNHYEPAELKANWPPQRVWVAAVFFLRGSNSLSRGTLSGSHFGDVFRCNRGISQTWTRFPPHVMFVGGSEPVKSRVWTSSEHYPITCCGPIFPTARSVFVGGWESGGGSNVPFLCTTCTHAGCYARRSSPQRARCHQGSLVSSSHGIWPIEIDDFPSYKPPFISGIVHGYVSHKPDGILINTNVNEVICVNFAIVNGASSPKKILSENLGMSLKKCRSPARNVA